MACECALLGLRPPRAADCARTAAECGRIAADCGRLRQVVETLETSDGLADSSSVASSKHDRLAARGRSRKAILTSAILAPGRVTLRAGAKTAVGVKNVVNRSITKGKAGVGGVIDGQRERRTKHVQRREAALAQVCAAGSDPDCAGVRRIAPECAQSAPSVRSECALSVRC